MTDHTEHVSWMERCFDIAVEAELNREVPVGCIIVYRSQNSIIGTGRNRVNETKNATMHAEFVAIQAAREWCSVHNESCAEVFRNCVLYVTVEPCIMCAGAIRLLEIPTVVYGCGNQRFGGCSSIVNVHDDDIDNYGCKFQCISDVMGDEAIDLLKKFYKGENPNAPDSKRKVKNS